VGVANASGVATVNFTQNIPATGTLYVVVTRQQYQPYFGTIQIVGGTQYNITVNQPQHGTISAPGQAYASATVTLEANPETGYCLSAWDVRDASNHSISVTNNQFTMPESNVTVTATFVQGLQVTLASVMHGNISANPTCALQGTTINLTATPASGYNFDSWIVYKTGDVNTTVTVNGNSFTMPNYPVTVSAIFSKPAGGEVTIGSGAGTDAGSDLPTDVYYKYCLPSRSTPLQSLAVQVLSPTSASTTTVPLLQEAGHWIFTWPIPPTQPSPLGRLNPIATRSIPDPTPSHRDGTPSR
jgi:hypothetical protein